MLLGLEILCLCSRTPLHWAAVCDNPDVIKALLAAEGITTVKIRSCDHSY